MGSSSHLVTGMALFKVIDDLYSVIIIFLVLVASVQSTFYLSWAVFYLCLVLSLLDGSVRMSVLCFSFFFLWPLHGVEPSIFSLSLSPSTLHPLVITFSLLAQLTSLFGSNIYLRLDISRINSWFHSSTVSPIRCFLHLGMRPILRIAQSRNLVRILYSWLSPSILWALPSPHVTFSHSFDYWWANVVSPTSGLFAFALAHWQSVLRGCESHRRRAKSFQRPLSS